MAEKPVPQETEPLAWVGEEQGNELTCSWVPNLVFSVMEKSSRRRVWPLLPTASRNPVSLLSGNLEQ